jgi:CheY-like chemotaxis protein
MACDTLRGTILIVDDNADLLRFARVFLETAGYKVFTASDGAEGLTFYQEHRSEIQMLLTDITMPKMGGLELAGRLLGMNAKLPVVFMSGSALSAQCGSECLAKPFRASELIETVSRVLDTNAQSQKMAAGAA